MRIRPLCQAHPFPALGTDDDKRLVTQLSHLDANYNGGLQAYIQNAKRLLDDSREGAHAFGPYTLEAQAASPLSNTGGLRRAPQLSVNQTSSGEPALP